MKKFIIIVLCIALLFVGVDAAYYRLGVYIDLNPSKEVKTFVKTKENKILLNSGKEYNEFEIKGVNLGSGEPGEWSTDFSIDKETYKRWFKYIKEMGANTIRVYTIQNDTFYNAFYEYNYQNPDPLYMIHGVWVNDYVQNSHRDAYDKDFYTTFSRDSITMIDVIHGKKKLSLGRVASAGHGTYRKDVSEWVIGYILGVEWDDITVAYTDETYKNMTEYAVNLTRNPYWSDYQTNEQYFGLLSFDPGKEKSVCYADGDISEWSGEKPVVQSGDMSVSIRYDERFMYFLIYKKNLDFENDKIFIPIDTTPKSGSNYCENFGLKFDKAADFVLVINGKDNSRLMVQERYEVLRSTYSQNLKGFDTYLVDNVPDKNSSKFVNIDMILEIFNVTEEQRHSNLFNFGESSFETGKLRYGNANPDSADFDSLADFAQSGDYIEVKLPWQLLNFSDPSKMEILDDYYAGNYGIKFININKMNIGIMTESSNRCHLSSFELKGWGNKVTYHERLKNSYYLLQSYWNKEVSP